MSLAVRLAEAARSGAGRAPASLQALGAFGLCVAAASGGSAQAQAVDRARAVKADDTTDLTEVVVTGVRPLLGDKIPLSIQDTPQSVDVVSPKLLREQAATRLQDALRNVPGITLNAGEGAARGDTVNIRGFSAFNDFFLDGVRDAAVYTRDSFDLQEVEVLKGPSATLFGRGSTGGAINQVSKAPQRDPLSVFTTEFGTNDELRETLDLDRPLGSAAAMRLNAMAETSGVAERDLVHNRRWGVAPAVSFDADQDTQVTLAFLHLSEHDRPDVGAPFVDGKPAPVPRTADFGLASDHSIDEVNVATARVVHQFGPGLSMSDTFRVARYSYDLQLDAPNFGSTPPTPSTPLSNILVGRDSPSSKGVQTNLTDQLDATARFATGPFDHVLVAGVEVAHETFDIDRFRNPFNSNNSWIPETPLSDPNPNMIRPVEPVASVQDTTADSAALYVTDTIKLGPKLDFIAGARLDRFAATYRQTTLATGAILNLSRTDVVGSPRLALVYKPTPNQSLYLAYGTSFDPSAEALSLTTKTANLGPVKAKSYEAGYKATVLDGLLLTGAIFHTEVNNAQTNDPDNPTLTVLDGDVRVQGIEIGASGHLTGKLEITAGYTYLDGATSGSAGAIPYRDVAVPNLARNTANLWAEYDFSDAWEAGLGFNYLDHRIADIVTPGVMAARVPGYLVVNAMAAWKANDRLTLQLNAINLTNLRYYDGLYYTSTSENHVVPGAGRTVKLVARVSF